MRITSRPAGVVLAVAVAVALGSPAHAAAGGDRLDPGQSLAPGQSLSANGYRLEMQGDGNAVLRNSNGVPLWSSDTPGYNGADLEMQTDGNLVLYKAGHVALKATGRFDSNPSHPRQLVLQGDGNLVVYFNGVAQWASNTDGGRVAPQPTGARLCAKVGYYAGFRVDAARGNTLQTATAIALAESSCNPNARHTNTNGSTDTGLWQINSIHRQWTQSQLLDPQTNANAAWSISAGGTKWTDWVTYNNGAYRSRLGEAGTAVSQL